MICWYWWDQQEGKKNCHWLSWDKLSSNKAAGGLGFHDLHIFNLAMLARQSWRLLKYPDSLCAKVLKAKYFPDCDCYRWRGDERPVGKPQEEGMMNIAASFPSLRNQGL
jgi:hypothetical protein